MLWGVREVTRVGCLQGKRRNPDAVSLSRPLVFFAFSSFVMQQGFGFRILYVHAMCSPVLAPASFEASM